MTASFELSGVTVVAAGSLNPAIFHPRWLADNGLIAENEAEHALTEIVVTPQLTAFQADWLSVQITQNQAIFSTVEEARGQQVRDLARSCFDLLPQTPIDAVGINADAHFRTESEDSWHAFGDRVLPKQLWEPLFADKEWASRSNSPLKVGLSTVTTVAYRQDQRGFAKVEIAPSTRLQPYGVYIGINSHIQLSVEGSRGNGHEMARTLDQEWDSVRQFERELLSKMLELAS